MTRQINHVTGELSFERRQDLSPEFDTIPSRLLEEQFKLPRDVDFTVILGTHYSKSNFDFVIPSLSETDVYLTEFAEADFEMMLFARRLSQGDKEAYSILKRLLKTEGAIEDEGWTEALFENIYRYRPKLALFDPEAGNAAYDAVSGNGLTFSDLNDSDSLDMLLEPSFTEIIERDRWCLKHVNVLVNRLMPYKKGDRRKVLISRGVYHLGLLRALEYVCNFDPVRARGSAVVSSTVMVQEEGQSSLDMFHYGRLLKN